MDDTRDVTQDGQEDVDEKVGIATTLKENTKRRQNDGEDDLDDVAVVVCQYCESEEWPGAAGSCWVVCSSK